MFLRSLVVRGFKSFADKTTLEFEPGVTIVVGPNGSGKSNVVDAISWVLGEQGPRALRGGKMEDVIFAGSRLRPALGMAEVTLTIDNSAGLLPIEFSDVTISRILFRSGESEYRLNGAACRLLDIQEVLSDSGIGREQHTIIGQGQLEAVLNADPQQMRGFIEEAAGIAKHRRRKDRALRKIAATEQNLLRLSDLLAEIRRQLRPLREQAEVAKRYSALSEELGRIRLVMSARELRTTRERLGAGETDGDVDALIHSKETELSQLERRLGEAENSRLSIFSASELERDVSWSFARVAERLASLSLLAAERERTLDAELAGATEAAAQAHVDEIERQLEQTLAQLREATEVEDRATSAAQEAVAVRSERQASALASEAELKDVVESHRAAIAESVRIRGEIAAIESALAAAEAEAAELELAAGRIERSMQGAEEISVAERERLTALEVQEGPLAERLQEMQQEAASKDDAVRLSEVQLREAELELARWRARAEVRPDAPASVAHRAAEIDGFIGVLADLVSAPPDLRAALAAVAGDPERVVVVADRSSASRVVEMAAGDGVAVLVADETGVQAPPAKPISELLEVHDLRVVPALAAVFLAESSAQACQLAAAHPGCVFVTADGTMASAGLLIATPSDARAKAEEAQSLVIEARSNFERLSDEASAYAVEMLDVNASLNEADAAISAAAEALAANERELHAAHRELQATQDGQTRLSASVEVLRARLGRLSAELPASQAEIDAVTGRIDELNKMQLALDTELAAAVSTSEEAKMAAAMASERRRLLEDRRASLQAAAAEAADLSAGLESRREELARALVGARSIAESGKALAAVAREWETAAEDRYRSARQSLEDLDAEVARLRLERAGLAGAVDDLRVKARQEDLGRSEMKIRIRILEERMREEWHVDPATVVAKFGHHWEVEDPSRLEDVMEKLAALDDDVLGRRQARIERDLEQMGRVNPLAAQEFEALTERESFLASQIADVRASRRDLYKVVTSVDEQVKELFTAAFDDVAREYERLFAMLFPGGQGRLRLTEPTDLLETGVEVEARPGGKNLKRLSLLSGGEKALSALAVLFAIFRARPSPFYVLDEVEAALDDVNLHRFLGLLREFRDSSQLLVVTHQKRTMEVADILYGVSIRPDGASRVISQKLNDVESEARELPAEHSAL